MQLTKVDKRLIVSAELDFDPDKDQKIGLAVSGGSDSMALLQLQALCAKKYGRRLTVATVDHGLRPEANAEAEFVAAECDTFGISHTTLKWDGWNGKGNLQAAARDARYQLLAAWGRSSGCDVICLGHTQDDVAENFLMSLKRSAGLDGLAAMDKDFERHGARFKRPLLFERRADLRGLLTRFGKTWCDDPSNEDTSFERVNIRKAIDGFTELGITPVNLARSAVNLGWAKQSLQRVTRDRAQQILSFDRGDVIINRDALAGTDLELQRRIIRLLLQWIGVTDYPPREAKMYELTLNMTEQSGKPYMVNGCAVTRNRRELRIAREPEAALTKVDQTTELWDARWRLDGPHAPDLEIRALGPDGLPQCPDWRSVGLPRTSLLSSPAIWRGDELIAAPLAKLNTEWTATLMRGEKQFFSSIVPH